ncbi:MAG: glycosyltransferase family 2 protein [Deltaproteobacteria bacterium]|jgi:dolichol-phosphate mannosyltransferase|nr:glycosyltransferase family 2 protein [Deltaproteobacteria bacterium]
MRNMGPDSVISVVAPFYNEVKNINAFVEELENEFEKIGYSNKHELILVNDGSTDGSDRELERIISGRSGNIKVIHLSRNFGHASAVYAGLKHASGEVIILMDSDMQDDPGCFELFLQKWREGYDVVYSKRSSRRESAPLRFLFWLFYRILLLMSDTYIPPDAGNFALMDKRVVNILLSLPEKNIYVPGLRAWVGFKQIGLPVPRRLRYDQSPRTNLKAKWNLAINAIFSFSYLPLIIFRILGILALMVSIFLASFTLYHKLISGLAVTAWASNLITMTFFGGLNLFGIGIIGEYISRIYNEVRARPRYIIDRIAVSETASDSDKMIDP